MPYSRSCTSTMHIAPFLQGLGFSGGRRGTRDLQTSFRGIAVRVYIRHKAGATFLRIKQLRVILILVPKHIQPFSSPILSLLMFRPGAIGTPLEASQISSDRCCVCDQITLPQIARHSHLTLLHHSMQVFQPGYILGPEEASTKGIRFAWIRVRLATIYHPLELVRHIREQRRVGQYDYTHFCSCYTAPFDIR